MSEGIRKFLLPVFSGLASVIFLALVPSQIPSIPSPFGMTPRTLPYVAGTFCLIMCALHACSLIFGEKKPSTIPGDVEKDSPVDDENPKSILPHAVIVLVIYLAAMPIVGFLIATVLSTFALMMMPSRASAGTKLFLAAVFVLAEFALFRFLLDIDLPTLFPDGAL